MIAYLNGILQKKLEKKIILNVNNVGYLVTVPATMLFTLEEGQKIELYIHTAVREDDISLYGLPSADSIKFFNQLISVQGIGPKMATDMMSLPTDNIKNAIINGDTATLTSIPGVGKKIAERLVTELKDKIEMVSTGTFPQHTKGSLKRENEEAVDALIGLGYQRNEVIRKLKDMPEKIQKTEDIVRYFLQGA